MPCCVTDTFLIISRLYIIMYLSAIPVENREQLFLNQLLYFCHLQADYELLKSFAGEEGKCLEYIEWTLGKFHSGLNLIKDLLREECSNFMIIFYIFLNSLFLLFYLILLCIVEHSYT